MTETPPLAGTQDEDDAWPDDLDLAAAELLDALRWQLGMLRVNYLKPVGWEARRAVFAARSRVFAAITGTSSPQPYIINRALALASAAGTPAVFSAPSPASSSSPGGSTDSDPGHALDGALTASMNEWAALDLAAFWSATSAYAKVSDSIVEHVMLLSYLQAILPAEGTPSALEDAQTAVPTVAAVTQVTTSNDPADIYTNCSQLTVSGVEASKQMTIDVALLALASVVPPQN